MIKKIENRAAEIVIITLTTIIMCTSCTVTKEQGNNEVVNTAESMIEWIGHDVESGKLDSTIADTYIINLEEIINTAKHDKVN